MDIDENEIWQQGALALFIYNPYRQILHLRLRFSRSVQDYLKPKNTATQARSWRLGFSYYADRWGAAVVAKWICWTVGGTVISIVRLAHDKFGRISVRQASGQTDRSATWWNQRKADIVDISSGCWKTGLDMKKEQVRVKTGVPRWGGKKT